MFSVKGLYYNYGDVKILENINMDIEKGKVIGLIGNNGAGKTTFFELITGIKCIDTGEISLNDCSHEDRKYMENIYFIPDEPIHYKFLTCSEYLSLILSLYKKSVDFEVISKYTNKFKIDLNSNLLLKEYSKGMKVKVAIIAGFLINPSLLVLDEPFNGLDPTACIQLINMLKTFSEKGSSVLLSSHTLNFVQEISDEVFLLKNKEVMQVSNSNLERFFV
ncbi:ABC transporter ATP-binding protein [Bacillus sp. A116_S68]|nr:ABC transporter ATP-binding protein [Bacillus sp. A116_S68]